MQSIISILMICYIGLFLGQAFFFAPYLHAALVFTALLVCILTFSAARRSTQIISLFLTAIGVYLMLTFQATPTDWTKAGTHNAAIISLVLAVPLFGTILHFEPYQQHLSAVASRFVTSPYRFYVVTALLVNVLSALLNVASFHFVHQLLRHIAKKFPTKLFNSAIMRGFLPNMLWSPSYISLALAIQYTNITWFAIAPMGIMIAATGLTTGLLLGWFEYGRRHKSVAGGEPSHPHSTGHRQENKGLLKLVVQTGLLILLIITLEFFTHKSALVIVPLVSFAGPFLLALFYGKTDVYALKLREFLSNTLPRLHNEVILFSAVGLFGYALGLSNIPEYIPALVTQLGLNSPYSLVFLFVSTIFSLSMVGVHPMITIAAIAASFPSGSVPLSNLQMAGSFVTGYMVYAALSPFSAVNMVFGTVFQQDPLTVGLKQNSGFTLIFSLLAVWIILGLFG